MRKPFLSVPVAILCNFFLQLLQQNKKRSLSREEIRFLEIYFSQFGEDIVVTRLAQEMGIKNGFYVDVGAFHPIQYSNTLLLHKAGWHGVNVDFSPSKIREFQQLRPQDINICALLSDSRHTVQVSQAGCLEDGIISTSKVSTDIDATQIRLLETETLTDLLKGNSVNPRTIDYLNIDCEGHDLEVLRGLNLQQYPVNILTIETLNSSKEQETIAYARNQGLILKEKIKWTLIFVAEKWISILS